VTAVQTGEHHGLGRQRANIMLKLSLGLTAALIATASIVFAQQASPAAKESATIDGKTITILYNSPRVNGRAGKLFGKDEIAR
jgi:hypothetical protein